MNLAHGMKGWKQWTARIARCAAAFTLACAATAAHAGPAPGTNISNQATAAGSSAGSPMAAMSNTVTAVVGNPVLGSYSATLTASQVVPTQAGATVFVRHVL